MINTPDELQKPWSLLPENSTELEKSLEIVLRPDPIIEQAIKQLSAVSEQPPESFLPFLAWERGLLPILPYLNDIRRAIEEGGIWQKERGTEQAIQRALKWLDFEIEKFTEEGQGYHWREIQIGLHRIPSPAEIDAIKRLVELSARAITQLKRLHNAEYNIPRFVFDNTQELDHHLLDNYSGVFINEVWQSFGKKHGYVINANKAQLKHTVHHYQRIFTIDNPYQDLLLDENQLFDEIPRTHPLSARSQLLSNISKPTAHVLAYQHNQYNHAMLVLDDRSNLDSDDNLFDPKWCKPEYQFYFDNTQLDNYKNDKDQPLDRVNFQSKQCVIKTNLNKNNTASRAEYKTLNFARYALYPLLLDDQPILPPALQTVHQQSISQHYARPDQKWRAYWNKNKTWETPAMPVSSCYQHRSEITKKLKTVTFACIISVQSAIKTRPRHNTETQQSDQLQATAFAKKHSFYPAYWERNKIWDSTSTTNDIPQMET